MFRLPSLRMAFQITSRYLGSAKFKKVTSPAYSQAITT